MKDYFYAFVLLALAFSLRGQNYLQECATEGSQYWSTALRQKMATMPAISAKAVPEQVPYRIHLFKKSDNTSVLTLQDIYKEIDTVNAFYANANMFFYECEPPEIILDDSLYDFQSSEESILINQHYSPDVLNLYFPNTVKSGTTPVCGYSRYPPSVDLAIIAAGCAKNGSTLPHEIGHYFGLMHTHESFAGAELVDGSNCSVAGDFICDTPADPTLDYSNVSLSCIYTGTVTDGNGMPYQPDVTNVMSYSRKECRMYFSPMQYAALNSTFQTDRSYLYCSYGVGLREFSQQKPLVFPNPGSDKLGLRLPSASSRAMLVLTDILGHVILTASVNGSEQIDTQALLPGIYFYELSLPDGKHKGKWIKQ